jgi:hypothetical protein
VKGWKTIKQLIIASRSIMFKPDQQALFKVDYTKDAKDASGYGQ